MNKPIPQKYNIVFIATTRKLKDDKTGVYIYGTGFIVKKNKKQFIVSCDHIYKQIPDVEKQSMICGVISAGTKDSKKIKQYEFYGLNFLKRHREEKRDICLFEFSERVNEGIKEYGYCYESFSSENDLEKLDGGEDVYFAGYPLANEFLQQRIGLTLALNKAIISDIKYSNADGRVDFIFIDKLVNPGSSGSPVFLKEDIIGIASATLNKSHRIGETLINIPVSIGVVRPSNYILELLDSIG